MRASSFPPKAFVSCRPVIRLRHKRYVQSQAQEGMVKAMCSARGPRRMTVLFSPEFLKHRAPGGHFHVECPERLDVCLKALQESTDVSNLLDWVSPQTVDSTAGSGRREVVLEAVRDTHNFPDYLDRLARLSDRGGGLLDGDTYVCGDSFEVALLAASTWMEAVELAVEGGKASWALTRPPGHHAVPASGMGFCLLSNAAIAAKYALKKKLAKNVAILDFDVHHGNGTEACVKNEEGIRFASSHQWPLYPRSGVEGTSGKFANVLNINLAAGSGLEQYRDRFEKEMLPFLLESASGMPDLVIVSAGFDALDVDPLAQLNFKPSDYRLLTQLLVKAIGEKTKLVFGLEGGYNLGEDGLGAAVRECASGYCVEA